MTTSETTTTTTDAKGSPNVTPTTTTTTDPYSRSVAAVRDMRTEADRWTLADALLAEVGQGQSRRAFHAVRNATERAGIKPLSVSAMRQYRDAAARYPESARVEGVSFSAHRAALPAADPAGILRDLAKVGGAASVTVANVKAAVAAANGLPTVSRKRSTSGGIAPSATEDLASALWRLASRDQGATAKRLADHLRGDALETLAATLADAIAAQGATSAKRSAWSGTTSAPTSAPTAPAVSAPSAGKVGDLRGL